MNTTKLARRLVLGIGIPAALATGAIAAAASTNGSSSDKPATTITQTAPASTGVSRPLPESTLNAAMVLVVRSEA